MCVSVPPTEARVRLVREGLCPKPMPVRPRMSGMLKLRSAPPKVYWIAEKRSGNDWTASSRPLQSSQPPGSEIAADIMIVPAGMSTKVSK